jgi:hypothetical protein
VCIENLIRFDCVAESHNVMRALRDSECSGSDSQMQRFESRHLG